MSLFQCPVIQAVPQNTPLILFKQDQPVSHALNTLATHKILSAPVFDTEGRSMIGQIDILDILTYVLSVSTRVPTWSEDMCARFKRPIQEAIGSSLIDPFYPVASSMPLSGVITQLFSYGIHRVPVIDSSGEMKGILSQSDVINYVAENVDSFELYDLMDKTVQELDLAPGKVTSITDECSLMQAFTIVMGCDISAVPIVSTKDGSLNGTLSASDFKGVHESTLPILSLPVKDYMSHSPLTCTLSTPLRDVIQIIAETGVHRVFVVEGIPKKPVGVISLTDIIRLLSKELLGERI